MLWKLWDPEFQRVKAQAEVVFNKEKNAHMLCQHGSNEIDMFGLPEDEKYIEETDTEDELLQDRQPCMQKGKRSKSHMYDTPDGEAESACSQRLPWEDQTAQCSGADAENIAKSRCLCREHQTAQRSAAAIEQSSQVRPASPAPPIGSRVSRGQGTNSGEALTASAATGDPSTYTEAMESTQRNHTEGAMKEESTLILPNNTFSALNSQKAQQLQVKPIGSKWVDKTKQNRDRSTQNTARLVCADGFQWNLCPCWENNYVWLSHLSHWEIPVEYVLLGCCYRFHKPWNRRWRHLYDSATMMARGHPHTKDHCETQESSLCPYTSSPAMERQYQCISTHPWVHTVISGSQPLSPQQQYSDASMFQLYLHVISAGRCQGCHQGPGKSLREIYDHKPPFGPPMPRHQDPPWRKWYQNYTRSECLHHYNRKTIQHGVYSQCLNTHGYQDNFGLGPGLGGDGIGRYHRLSNSCGMTSVLSTYNSARYLICGFCSFSLQFAAIHQPYDRC